MTKWQDTLWEYAKTFGSAAILATFIITFIAQSYVVEGGSMQPTFYDRNRLMVDKVSYRLRAPRRGEVVVFRYPANPSQRFIKRVVGLPGDTVQIKNNTLYVNENPIKEDYINDRMYGEFGPLVVPPDTVFVLGDNRNNSDDSRFPDVGPVPDRNLVGRALFQYWPLNKIRPIHVPQVLNSLAGTN